MRIDCCDTDEDEELKPTEATPAEATIFRMLLIQRAAYIVKPVASTINTLAALYKVFSASSDQARIEMRQACFDYLSL
ncbi:unnamed protein product [Rhodiola kirilowii]